MLKVLDRLGESVLLLAGLGEILLWNEELDRWGADLPATRTGVYDRGVMAVSGIDHDLTTRWLHLSGNIKDATLDDDGVLEFQCLIAAYDVLVEEQLGHGQSGGMSCP